MAALVVVDTSALMAILLQEPDAIRYAQALHDADELRLSAPTWLEAAQVSTGRRGAKGYEEFSDLISRLRIEIMPCNEVMARRAFDAWLHFGKGRHPAGLNFGDCFSYALAKLRGEPLLFKGDDFPKTDVIPAL